MKNSTPNPWAVALPCPQCGADVSLEETDRVFSCPYCRVRLLWLPQGSPQYLLLPFQEGRSRPPRYYVPYWRLRGLAFDFFRRSPKDRVIDATFLAVNNRLLPPYLGLQARAFKLRIPSPDLLDRMLTPQRTLPDILAQVATAAENPSEEDGPPATAAFPPVFIGETISRVFAPIYFQEGMVYDGLGNRPIGRGAEEDFQGLDLLAEKDRPSSRFLPALCPYCGADLQGEKDAWVFLCRNCDRVWQQRDDRLDALDFGVMEPPPGDPPFFLPFWRIRPPVGDGLEERLPKRIPSLWSPVDPSPGGEEEKCYWLPAFKLSPSPFLHAARAVTIRQPARYRLLQTLPQGRYYPVNLPWEQAAEGLLVLAADIRKGPVSPWSEFIPSGEQLETLLVFVPFHLRGNELVQEIMSVGISPAALHFGRFL